MDIMRIILAVSNAIIAVLVVLIFWVVWYEAEIWPYDDRDPLATIPSDPHYSIQKKGAGGSVRHIGVFKKERYCWIRIKESNPSEVVNIQVTPRRMNLPENPLKDGVHLKKYVENSPVIPLQTEAFEGKTVGPSRLFVLENTGTKAMVLEYKCRRFKDGEVVTNLSDYLKALTKFTGD